MKLVIKRDRVRFKKKRYDFRALPFAAETEIDACISYVRDASDGGRVLVLTEDAPVFDSSDTIYDSTHSGFIKRTGDTLTALYIRGAGFPCEPPKV